MACSDVVAVIPARYASTRLPGKPLLKETGKFLIQHVWEQARACSRLDRILVATDDVRIAEAVRSFGGEVVMTSPDHPSGSDRVAEAVRDLDCTRVINIQGDEPEVVPAHVDTLVDLLEGAEMSTLATPFTEVTDASRPERVKVVLDQAGFALYFSRSRIPHQNGTPSPAYLHLGLYGYTKEFLLRFVSLAPTPLEKAERLEQLRALEHGHRIRVGVIEGAAPGGIDTPEDYSAFVTRWRERET